jgi:predicted phage tail protein
LHAEELYFNGSVVQRTNLRQFISEIAPFFLCNFAIKNGKFTLMPALPTDGKNRIESGPVQVDQLFTGGNILENTFKVEYLGAEERRPFVAVVRYRQERPNEFPEEKVLTVKGGSAYNENSLTELPQETFDLTQFCTSEEHAIKVAKYFLILRRFVSHTISFSTTVDGLNIGVGSFIKVSTESNPYNSANNGTIDENGSITSVRTLTDGFYDIEYYSASLNDDVVSAKMQVSNGTVSDSTLFDSVFTLSNKSVSSNIYIIEQLTFSQEGTVDIVASEHVCDSSDRSRLVDEFLNGSFTVN